MSGALRGVGTLHYKILRRTMYGVIFDLIWTPYNYAGWSGVSVEL